MHHLAKLIAFYLPQFHPIPENDQWWGAGFTEWRNVAAARPRYSGHYQPHLPADLGFYDLRVAETRAQQAELARSYGIHGFCYYHYWFGGKRLLNRPLDEVLSSGAPDFPFCLCWANENWTRRWDGMDQEVLIAQQYSPEDDEAHIQWLLKVFADPRYIKIDGRPLLLIYRYDLIPHFAQMVAQWRQHAKAAGFPDLYLCAESNHYVPGSPEYDDILSATGCDALLEFHPNGRYMTRDVKAVTHSRIKKLERLISKWMRRPYYTELIYERYMAHAVRALGKHDNVIPCVMPSWDNSARRKSHATIIQNTDPALYEAWLVEAMRAARLNNTNERLVFINAMNEWAEGCHLEPDLKMGHAFLQATRSACERVRKEQAAQ